MNYKTDRNALLVADQYVVLHGRSSKRKTTKGLNLCAQRKDGTTTWERLPNLKESRPIQVAEYSFAQGISHELSFKWWVTHVLKKLESIKSSLNGISSRVIKENIKSGI